MKAQVYPFSQYFVGKKKIGGDDLSRDCADISPTTHGFFGENYAHKQVPENLSIRPHPKEITSFIGSIR